MIYKRCIILCHTKKWAKLKNYSMYFYQETLGCFVMKINLRHTEYMEWNNSPSVNISVA